MNKTNIYLSLLLLCLTVVSSCSKDDDAGEGGGVPDVMYDFIGEEAISIAGGNIEVPAIEDRTMYVVHSTHRFGVTYSLEWDKDRKTQKWAAYTLTPTNNTKGWGRGSWNGYLWKGVVWSGDPFQEDSIIPGSYRTSLSDYRGSGYDRGHIVNSQDRLMSENHNGQTFYLSNIQPQKREFNGGIWLTLENKVHDLGTSLRGQAALYVVKGGTTKSTAKCPKPFKDRSMGSRNIPVPQYFWMAVVRKNFYGEYAGEAYWTNHDNPTWYEAITIDELEERLGFDLFHNLPGSDAGGLEHEVESKRAAFFSNV